MLFLNFTSFSLGNVSIYLELQVIYHIIHPFKVYSVMHFVYQCITITTSMFRTISAIPKEAELISCHSLFLHSPRQPLIHFFHIYLFIKFTFRRSKMYFVISLFCKIFLKFFHILFRMYSIYFYYQIALCCRNIQHMLYLGQTQVFPTF